VNSESGCVEVEWTIDDLAVDKLHVWVYDVFSLVILQATVFIPESFVSGAL